VLIDQWRFIAVEQDAAATAEIPDRRERVAVCASLLKVSLTSKCRWLRRPLCFCSFPCVLFFVSSAADPSSFQLPIFPAFLFPSVLLLAVFFRNCRQGARRLFNRFARLSVRTNQLGIFKKFGLLILWSCNTVCQTVVY
jgi:hypothetical protein